MEINQVLTMKSYEDQRKERLQDVVDDYFTTVMYLHRHFITTCDCLEDIISFHEVLRIEHRVL